MKSSHIDTHIYNYVLLVKRIQFLNSQNVFLRSGPVLILWSHHADEMNTRSFFSVRNYYLVLQKVYIHASVKYVFNLISITKSIIINLLRVFTGINMCQKRYSKLYQPFIFVCHPSTSLSTCLSRLCCEPCSFAI